MSGWNEPVEFFARTHEYIERLAPIWLRLDPSVRGAFFVPEALAAFADELGVDPVGLRGSVNRPLDVMPFASSAPVLTCGYRDLLAVTRVNSHRPNIVLQYKPLPVPYSDGGAHCKVSLFLCADDTIRAVLEAKWRQKKCVTVGESAEGAAEAIRSYAEARSNVKSVSEVNGQSIGIVYMSFGEKAARAVRESAMSLRQIGWNIPVCVIGTTPVRGFDFIEWTGESPFDGSQRPNFQFRAGRVKPKLYELSPFERTLYIDADTEFMADILPGFEALDEADAAIAREELTLGQLYNKKLAGWEINIMERDATVRELGAGPDVYFLNSGVLFFRKSPAAETAMRRWHEAWQEWQQWDEQLAFMRAFHRTPEAKVKILEPEWNYPHRRKDIVIFHNYGRGVVRMNVPPPAAVDPARLAVGNEAVA